MDGSEPPPPPHWRVRQTRASPTAGNKADLSSKRVVSMDVAQAFAKEHNVTYIETSAKESSNVEQAFMTMAAQIKQRLATQPQLAGKQGGNIQPKAGQAIKSGSGCC